MNIKKVSRNMIDLTYFFNKNHTISILTNFVNACLIFRKKGYTDVKKIFGGGLRSI